MRRVWVAVVGVMLLAAAGATFAAAKEAISEKVPPKPFIYKCDPADSVEMAHACNERDANDIARLALKEAGDANSLNARAVKDNEKNLNLVAIASIVSAISLMLTFVGLHYGRQSAKAAYRALDVGRALVLPIHAHVSLKVTRERDGTFSKLAMTGYVTWKNMGDRPALKIAFDAGLVAAARFAPPPRLPVYHIEGFGRSLESGEQQEVKIRPLDEEILATFLGPNDSFIYLVGLVSYFDRTDPEKVLAERITMLIEPFTLERVRPGGATVIGMSLMDVIFPDEKVNIFKILHGKFDRVLQKRRSERLLKRIQKQWT